jgi:hypothetical protein
VDVPVIRVDFIQLKQAHDTSSARLVASRPR